MEKQIEVFEENCIKMGSSLESINQIFEGFDTVMYENLLPENPKVDAIVGMELDFEGC